VPGRQAPRRPLPRALRRRGSPPAPRRRRAAAGDHLCGPRLGGLHLRLESHGAPAGLGVSAARALPLLPGPCCRCWGCWGPGQATLQPQALEARMHAPPPSCPPPPPAPPRRARPHPSTCRPPCPAFPALQIGRRHRAHLEHGDGRGPGAAGDGRLRVGLQAAATWALSSRGAAGTGAARCAPAAEPRTAAVPCRCATTTSRPARTTAAPRTSPPWTGAPTARCWPPAATTAGPGSSQRAVRGAGVEGRRGGEPSGVTGPRRGPGAPAPPAAALTPAARRCYMAPWRPSRPAPCAGELVRVLKKHTGPIFSLKWNKKGSYLLSGSVDRTAILWDAKTGEVKQQWQLHQGARTVCVCGGGGSAWRQAALLPQHSAAAQHSRGPRVCRGPSRWPQPPPALATLGARARPACACCIRPLAATPHPHPTPLYPCSPHAGRGLEGQRDLRHLLH
jgi:hypothetical protein